MVVHEIYGEKRFIQKPEVEPVVFGAEPMTYAIIQKPKVEPVGFEAKPMTYAIIDEVDCRNLLNKKGETKTDVSNEVSQSLL